MVTRFRFFCAAFWFASSRSAGVVFLSNLVINLPEQVLGECAKKIPGEIKRFEHISVLVGSLGNEFTLRVKGGRGKSQKEPQGRKSSGRTSNFSTNLMKR
jgi:hypothetical protein